MQSLLFSALCLKLFWILSCRGQSWTNDGVYYGMLGSNVTLACGTSPQRSPVEWRLNQSSTLPWHRVSANGSLVLFNVDQSAQGNYSCHGDQGPAHSAVWLRLGYPPGPLNVTCRVPSHIHVRCSWVPGGSTFLPAQYHAFYRGSTAEWRPCVVDPTNHHCDITRPYYWQLNHWLNVTEVNPLGARLTRQTIQLHKLLKPDPPVELVVRGQPSLPTLLNVSWRYPLSWPQLVAFPLLFQIRYRPHGSRHWAQMESMGTSLVVHDALEGFPHEVQVRAQDEANADSQWSDWSPLVLARPWEAPGPGTEQSDVSGGTPPTDLFSEVSICTDTLSSKNQAEEEEKLSLVILLVLFSIVIFIIILSLTVVMCMRQRRRHVTKQEVSSMLKMKAIPL